MVLTGIYILWIWFRWTLYSNMNPSPTQAHVTNEPKEESLDPLEIGLPVLEGSIEEEEEGEESASLGRAS